MATKKTPSPATRKTKATGKQAIVIAADGIRFTGFTSAHELLGFTEIYGDGSQILLAAVKVIKDRWNVTIPLPGMQTAAPKPSPAPAPAKAKRPNQAG